MCRCLQVRQLLVHCRGSTNRGFQMMSLDDDFDAAVQFMNASKHLRVSDDQVRCCCCCDVDVLDVLETAVV